MGINHKLIGQRIINRHKERLSNIRRKGPSKIDTKKFFIQRRQAMDRIRRDVKRVREIKKKHAKAPKKVTIRNPLVPKILQPIANITPLGWFKGTTTHKQPLNTADILRGIGGVGQKGRPRTMPVRYGGTQFRFDNIEEPEEKEVQVQPHPLFEDTVKTGTGLDEEAYQQSYKETIGDIQFPMIEPIKPPDWTLPDFKLPDFGKIGTMALLGIAGIVAIMLLGGRK